MTRWLIGSIVLASLGACGNGDGDASKGARPESAVIASDSSPRDTAASPRDSAPVAEPRDPRGRSERREPRLPPGDTMRGTLRVEGAEPATRVMLRSASTAREVAGPHTAALSRLDGVTVLARGTVARNVITVADFVVTSVGGEPVLDGRIAEVGDTLAIVTMDGRRVALSTAPASLRALAGHRVWLRTAADGEPLAWRRID